MEQSVVFITKSKFPDGNAFATYVGGIASIFHKNMFDVLCIGGGTTPYKEVFDGYFGKYVSLRKNKTKSTISKILNQLFFEKRVLSFLKRYPTNVSHVFLSCEFSISFYKKVKKLFNKQNVCYSFVITEEYTKDEFEKYTLLSRKSFKINQYFLNKYFDSKDSFVVISKYLECKIESRGMKVVYVPFSFNFSLLDRRPVSQKQHNKINFLYCGSPENKDLLPTLIEAFSNLDEKRKKLSIFHVIGVNECWAIKHGIKCVDKSVITFYGRKDRDFINEFYTKIDYSVLLRDEEKVFAKAGFPTKISEAAFHGVTPLTNLTSNLSDYLNSQNSIIVNGHSVDAALKAIEFAIDDIKNNGKRKANILKTAEQHFNIDVYEDRLLSLLK